MVKNRQNDLEEFKSKSLEEKIRAFRFAPPDIIENFINDTCKNLIDAKKNRFGKICSFNTK